MPRTVHDQIKAIPPLDEIRGRGSAVASPLMECISAYYARHGRPKRGAHILVAVSGGPDSVALTAALLIDAPNHCWTVGVAHVHHGLRGREADDDERLVRALARRWGVRLHVRHGRCPRDARINRQSWARGLRYEFLERTAARYGYNRIAVAHHRDDRAESVAAAVLDAAGTFALAGIPPVRGRIIRPLFDCPRDVITAFLKALCIPSRTDSSNCSGDYQRNRIRARILPQWQKENPAIASGLARLGEQVWLQRCFLEEQARRVVVAALRDADPQRMILATGPLRRYHPALDPFVLRELTTRIGLEIVVRPNTVARFSDLRRGGGQGGAVIVEQGDLVIQRSQREIAVWRKSHVAPRKCRTALVPRHGLSARLPGMPRLRTAVVTRPPVGRADDARSARLDLDRIAGPLRLRHPEPGDRYSPVGLDGSKKLADLLAERGVPVFRRLEVPVLTDDVGIVWPIGHPIAARAIVTPRTRRVLVARIIGQEG